MDRSDEIVLNARVAIAIIDRNEAYNDGRKEQVMLHIADLITEYRRIEQELLIMKVEMAKCEQNEKNYAWLTNEMERVISEGGDIGGEMATILNSLHPKTVPECIERMAKAEATE